ncbi:MAG: tetratricopeptide repeat protein [Bacteroidota bacterium]
MSSVIQGYHYDIFISYRQKDNKADHWVTHFVEHLKDEIEATFKEDISIYFDENPQDGLLETHDVDQSLKEKINVLIFIPIISQTYCDPNSFAWQNEFIAFRNFARTDKLGLDQKLPCGNVCKRILPVKIHEIEEEDQALYEKETGGVMRSIDFIYKAAGVNRPLRPNEEHPDDNLNGTIYRDQINKVANAVKEIIYGIKKPQLKLTSVLKKRMPAKALTGNKRLTSGILIAAVIALMLIGYFTILKKPQILSRDYQNERTAIIPFTNNTNNPDLDILGFMAADWIIKGLMDFDNIKVVSYETITRNLATASIGNTKQLINLTSRMGADKVIIGSYYKQDDKLTFQTQLLDVKTGEVELVLPIVSGAEDNIEELVSDLNQRVMTIYGEVGSTYSKHILRNPPKYESYKQFHEGLKYFGIDYDKCRGYLYNAIELDSTFFWPYFFISVTYENEENIPKRDSTIRIADKKCKPYFNFQSLCLNWLFAPNRKDAYVHAKKMYEKDPQNHLVNLVVGQMAKYLNKPNEAISYFQELDYSSFSFHSPLELWWFRDYAYCLVRLERYDEALKLLENIPTEFIDKDLISIKVGIYILQNKSDKIFELIRELESTSLEQRLIDEVYLSASEWQELVGQPKEKAEWAQLALDRILSKPAINEEDKNNLVRAYYHADNFNKVLEIYEDYSNEGGNIVIPLSMVAICHLKTGNQEEVNQIITTFEKRGNPISLYELARIHSASDQKELAMQYLKEAFEFDYEFTIRRYDNDLFLAPLHGYPPFDEFVKPKDL